MTVNTATIITPDLPAGWHLEDALTQRAAVMCTSIAELEQFLDACETDALARFATPEGPAADQLFSESARDLLDTVEAWRDDLPVVFAELSGAEGC